MNREYLLNWGSFKTTTVPLLQEHADVKSCNYVHCILFECRGCDGLLFGSESFLKEHVKVLFFCVKAIIFKILFLSCVF